MVIKVQFYNIAPDGAILQTHRKCPSGRVVKAMPCYYKVIAVQALGFTCAGSNPVCDASFSVFIWITSFYFFSCVS